MMKEQEIKITSSANYDLYLHALCKLSSQYVSRIRVQFAEKAYEMYQNETVRRIVFAYGEEIEKLEHDRFRDFKYTAAHGAVTPESLEDSCLNNAKHYGNTIKMLFDIA